jgi:Mce-associated membrane protein
MSQQAAATRRKIAGERLQRTTGVGSLGADVDVAGTDSPARPGLAIRLRIGWVVPGWLLIGLAVATAAVFVFDTVAWARSGAASGESSAVGPDALNAAPAQAEKAAEQILSYDYADLQHDTAAGAAYMTPAYAQTFTRTVDDLLADSATAQRGVVSAKVMASGVVSVDGGKVDVLLFVDQTSTTKDDKAPQTALNRVQFAMVYENGRWLVDDVTAL